MNFINLCQAIRCSHTSLDLQNIETKNAIESQIPLKQVATDSWDLGEGKMQKGGYSVTVHTFTRLIGVITS